MFTAGFKYHNVSQTNKPFGIKFMGKDGKILGFPLKLNGVNSHEENMVTEEGKSKQNTKMKIASLQNRNDHLIKRSRQTFNFNSRK